VTGPRSCRNTDTDIAGSAGRAGSLDRPLLRQGHRRASTCPGAAVGTCLAWAGMLCSQGQHAMGRVDMVACVKGG